MLIVDKLQAVFAVMSDHDVGFGKRVAAQHGLCIFYRPRNDPGKIVERCSRQV